MILDRSSLSRTLENLNEAWFYGNEIPGEEKVEISGFLAGRQGAEGSYSGLPAPTAMDMNTLPHRLFTGEKLSSVAGFTHVIGEEALRALRILGTGDKDVREAVSRATGSFEKRLTGASESYDGRVTGFYCCGTCTVSYIRNLAIGTFSNSAGRMKAGLNELKKHRDGRGRWRRFPFYYTLLALREIGNRSARRELEYALPSIRRAAAKRKLGDVYARRRRDLAARIIEES